MKKPPNEAGAGNGAKALSFHVGRFGRAVPDLTSFVSCDVKLH
jgi:hypothetical protein